MEDFAFHDGNVCGLLESRHINFRQNPNYSLQMHSSLIQRLSQEKELEGHQGCVNAVAWNSSGSLLISGSDDTRINIWNYSGRKLLHSVETGHSANIFCTKFVPETSDELVVSGAGDAEVRLFNLSRLRGRGHDDNAIASSALYQCHTRRVKKLAVEIGNPNVVWSASEDGTLRQHDFREGMSCPPDGASHQECHNVLLDLRCGAKRSLADPPRQTLALKSCDISTTRPHLLLVGGSDAFARLYDRRMLPPLSSSQKRMSPPPCVNYFCPMHLSDRVRSGLHLTHVTFSPNGEEILLSYSGEHVYLMNVNHAGQSTMQYTSGDVSKLMSFTPILNGLELQYPISNLSNSLPRKWKNDVHMAIRDCYSARKIDQSSFRAHYYMSEALSQLGRHKEALDFAFAAQYLAPSNPEVAEKVESVKRDLAAAESEKSNKSNDGALRSAPLGGVLSLSDFLYRSDANSDVSQDGLRSEREDSDYDEEVELDFETLSGDEAHDVDSNVLQGSLNLRIHRRIDPARERVGANGTCGSPSSSQNDGILYQPEPVIDMKQRYVGHCNIGTDIKQASFLGQRGEYVASGSDDGRWFIWEKGTGRLIKILVGDGAVVNCVQSHPFDCAIATSGIDNTIKLWTPTAPVPSVVAGGVVGPQAADVLAAIENNQRRLCRNREAILPFEILERFRMHDFSEGSLHPFECAQS
ncbi:WD and tetratricopeptide repeats protein 1-like isoform X4 [Cucurbita pepo subsp. pepo]|uniref:WD and tetratricopeptide repeats protein 1-like isoform X4 n=1 Tax=Cucurbita pepo subsp. pepo TaxID=3664 RepID=UPI000C9D8B0F|nr:WD and tetratricopeptide repeats protein 1-like isoform X4 [Cucurbita pepo subsp. pepo]